MWTSKHRLSVNTDDMLNKLCTEWMKSRYTKSYHNVMITSRYKNKCEIQTKGGKRQGDVKRGGPFVMIYELSICHVARRICQQLTCQCCLS